MTTHKTIKSKADVVDLCQSRIQGIQTYVPAGTSIACAGKTYTGPQLAAVYQKCIDTRQALVGIRHQEEVALQARDAADASRDAVDDGLIQWAVNTFGPESQQAKDLGYTPRKPTPPTAATLAEAVAKAKATRNGKDATPAPAAPVAPAATPPVTPTTKS